MATKKTGINKGIEKGVSEELFKDKVICKKCGKEVEFTLESQLFQKCPRCGAKIERNLKREAKQANTVIKEDIKRRGKGKVLGFATFLTVLSIGYTVAALLTGLIQTSWLYALIGMPLVVVSLLASCYTKNSVSMKIKLFSKVMFIVNIVVLAAEILSIFEFARNFVGL